MEENRFYILSARKLTGELNEAEYRELEIIFLGNPLYKEMYKKLELSLPVVKKSILTEQRHILANLRAKLYSVPDYNPPVESTGWRKRLIKKVYRNNKFKTFCFFIVFLLASVMLYTLYSEKEQKSPQKETLSQNNISTKPGSKTQVTLPDGSKVILNADSKLSYPDNFMGDTREVTLEGEAFFDVTKNKKKPFIIHSKTMDIKVLGTVFNIRAYPSENLTEASLISGSIEVILKTRTNEKIFLKPNEKITVFNISEGKQMPNTTENKYTEIALPLISVNKLNFDNADNQVSEIAWTQNKLIFNNESLGNIVQLLQRWYGLEIRIETNELKDINFTGRFYSESISQVLEALQLTHKFNYSNNNGQIVIY